MPRLKPTIVKMTVSTTKTDTARAGTPERSPPLVLAHAQGQEDHADGEGKERYVAYDVVDGTGHRSFSADIDQEERCHQFGDAVETKEKEPDVGPAAWRDAPVEPQRQSEGSQAAADVSSDSKEPIGSNSIVAHGFHHGIDVGTEEVQCSKAHKVNGYAHDSEEGKNHSHSGAALALHHCGFLVGIG